MSTPSSASPSPRRREPGSLSGLWIYPLVVVLLAGERIVDLIRLAVERTLTVSLELPADEPVDTVIGDERMPLAGVVDLTLPLERFSSAAIVFQAASAVLLIVGLAIACWYSIRAVTHMTRSTPLDPRAARAMTGLFWTVVATGIVSGFVQMLGDNLVIRDLGLNDLPVDNSITTTMIWVWLAVVSGIGIIRALLIRGARAETELEGVI